MAAIFTVFLIATYGVGFNLLCSYNLQSTFAGYSFYDKNTTPLIIGAILAVLVGIVILGKGKSIERVTEIMVPLMGGAYVLVTIVIILTHITFLPEVFRMIFSDAFNFKAIGSGIAGSCMVYGIKRGLYSNEAGVGSAPNAAASADVSHPVKQGLVAIVSVSIDTIFLCTATALLCLVSGVAPTAEAAGAAYVQSAVSATMGSFGPVFITVAMVLFAFTTLIGNLYYVNNAVAYLNHKKMPGKTFMFIMHLICIAIIFIGTMIPMDMAWDLADITMAGMALINIPACLLLGENAIRAAIDYEKQKKQGLDPVFHAKDIGMDETDLDCWK